MTQHQDGPKGQKFVTIFDATRNVDFVGMGSIATKIGLVLSAITLVSAGVLGLNWGIDFAGGSEVQVKFEKPVTNADIVDVLEKQGFNKNQVQQYGANEKNEWLVRVERMSTVTDESIKKLQDTLSAKFPGKKVTVEHRVDEGDRISVSLPEPDNASGDALALVNALNEQQQTLASVVEAEAGLRLRRTKAEEAQEESTADAIVRDEPYQGQVQYLVQLQGVSDKLKKAFEGQFGTVEIRRVDFVDARVAEELRGKGVLALLLALALIIGYMALRFDVFFAPGALIATMHDPILALGLFVFGRVEFDQPSIAAMLTIIGYSVNGTIVIYDRIRETMPAGQVGFDEVKVVVNRAINDTFSRSINTVMTTLFTTVAVAVFTEGAVHNFALTLSVGFVIGTISSVLIAPTVYLFFRKNFYSGEAVVEEGGITREDRERGVV